MVLLFPIFCYVSEGPQAEVYGYSLAADNSTVTKISMGNLVGSMNSVSEISEDGRSLVSYLIGRESGDVEIILTRTREKG